MSENQRYEDGDIIKTSNGREFEVVAVTYKETDSRKYGFGYTIRDKEELDAERAEQKRLDDEREKFEAEQAAAAAKNKKSEPEDANQVQV